MEIAHATGTLELRAEAPTLRVFVEDTFKPLYRTKFRPGTWRRYEGLLRQGLLDELGTQRLDAIGATVVRGFMATVAKRGIQARRPVNLLRTFRGRYAYFAPAADLSLWRFDTQKDIAAARSWRQIQIQRPPNAPALKLTRPGAFDGRFLYLLSETELVRLDTEADPDSPDAWQTQGLNIEPSNCGKDFPQGPCPHTSSVFDGEYLNIVSGVHYRRLHVRSPKLPSPLPNGGSFF